jgi:hypothetical protein
MIGYDMRLILAILWRRPRMRDAMLAIKAQHHSVDAAGARATVVARSFQQMVLSRL